MRLLLDTHALIWTLLEKDRLAPIAINAINDGANDVFVSVINAWEIEIKLAKGGLRRPGQLEDALSEQRFEVLPVTLRHVLAVESLPRHHRDPFDRMLIAQAQLEGMTLITNDREVRRYPVATLPAS